MIDYFPTVLGLEQTKRKLNFLIESHKRNNYFPSTLICAGRGQGKTYLANQISKNLLSARNKEPKSCILINSGTLSDFNSFVTDIYIPVIQDKEITIIFDECHNLPEKLVTSFLTLFNPNPEHINVYNHGDIRIVFNFNLQTFLFVTSESQKVFAPLQDRLEKIALEPYSVNELGIILHKNLNNVNFEEKVLLEISMAVRGNPRKAIQLAEKIQCYLETKEKDKKIFTKNDWGKLQKILDIIPLGLNRIELEIMKTLAERRSCNLTTLASKTGLSRDSLLKDHEMYLLKQNLIQIASGSKRELTFEGYGYLRSLQIIT